MRLTQEQISAVNWNDFSITEIYALIDMDIIHKSDIDAYYNNSSWECA